MDTRKHDLGAAYRDARRVSTPLIAITTADPGSAADLIASIERESPVLQLDAARGLSPYSEKPLDVEARKKFSLTQPQSTNLLQTVIMAQHALDERGVLIVFNGHMLLTDRFEGYRVMVQAVWNLRDHFKVDGRALVFIGCDFTPPPELASDICVLDDPLPDNQQLEAIVRRVYKEATDDIGDIPAPTPDLINQAVEAVSGLATFPAEQVLSMSMRRTGLEIDPLWERKRQWIEMTPGLVPYRGTEVLEDLIGIDNVVDYVRELIDARAFNAVVFIDEMDKAMAGGMADHVGDSGVARDQVGQVLTYINDTKSLGIMLAGVNGTGKSQLAKAIGGSSGKPVIIFDLGGMKASHVGTSETNVRRALKVITAVARGRVLFVGTANKTTVFSPEMNRRFPDQFFFDKPSDDARIRLWKHYTAKHRLTPEQVAFPAGFDTDWTGAEIERACVRAELFTREGHVKTVVQAAQYIIPTMVRNGVDIDAQRQAASGRFLSASTPGWYQYTGKQTEKTSTAPASTKGRRFTTHES